MHIRELTPFLQLGQEKAFWRWSWRNMIGLIGGLIVGSPLSRALELHGPPQLVLTVVLMVVGLWLSAERNRIWRVVRFSLRARVGVRQLTSATLDPQDWYAEPPPPLPVLPVRSWDGAPLLEVRPLDESWNGNGSLNGSTNGGGPHA